MNLFLSECMKSLWTLEKAEQERLQNELKSRALRKRYDEDPEIRQAADKIHYNRMMPGPACDQCIELTIARLDKKKSDSTV